MKTLADAGVGCVDVAPQRLATHVADAVSCSVGEDDVIIRTFVSTADRDAFLNASGGLVEQLDGDIEVAPHVVGLTWIVTADSAATAEQIRTILGGELR